jgi:hypothetical protein
MSIVVEVEEVESMDYLGEARPRGKDIETLMSQEPRISVSEANAPVDSSDSSSQWSDNVPVPGPYTYHIQDIHSQQSTQ